jgi:tripartite-type tricarboxylate transporter receptor subunit TctC
VPRRFVNPKDFLTCAQAFSLMKHTLKQPAVIIQRRDVLLGLTSAALASPAIAQGAWPNRPLRMIVPFTPWRGLPPASWPMRWALATAARTPLAPDLPTLAEAGLPGFEFFSWYSVWAPRGVPAEILQRLNRILVDGMRETATVQRLSGLGFEPVAETVEEAEAFIRADVARNAALLRLANFQPE